MKNANKASQQVAFLRIAGKVKLNSIGTERAT